jgi:hypothetical protein
VTPADITSINNEIEDLGEQLTGLEDNVNGLGDGLDELDMQVDGLEDELGGRLDALENPVPGSCSEEELCVPDGLTLSTDALAGLVAVVCEHEINCCNEDELNYKFGPGITTADDCEKLFKDLVENGQTPDFLDDSPYVVQQVILIAQALNDPTVGIELNEDGIEACIEALENRDCPEYVEPTDEEPTCENPGEAEADPCMIGNLVNGLQEEGELCGDYGYYSNAVPECVEGLYCSRDSDSNRGICAQLPSENDFCRSDDDCDPSHDEYYYGEELTNLFCNKSTSQCEPLGDVGDPCEFIDSTFSFYNSSIDPWGGNPSATSIDCLPHLACDPITDTCVNYCDEGWLCQRGESAQPCPNGDLVCNVTAIPGLWDNYNYGTCTEAIEEGEEATYADECASGALEPDEDDEELFHCVAPLLDPGEACPGETAGAADALCSTGWCNDDEECAAPCNCEGDDCDDYGTDEWGNDALECENGFYCDWGNYNSALGVYACEPKIGNGNVCDTYDGVLHTSCTSGFCNTLSTPTANQCAPKQTDATDAACLTMADQECPANQYCNTANICKPYVALDGDCNIAAVPALECAPGLVCVDGASGDTCEQRAELGDACNSGNSLAPQCVSNLTCFDVDGDGTGTASECYDTTGTFENGVNCSYWGLQYGLVADTLCASGWCPESTGVCTTKVAAGEPCDSSDSALDTCDDGYYCNHESGDDTEGECAAQREPGQSCKPYLNGMDCRKDGMSGIYSTCEFLNDQFVCSDEAQPPESLFCDGN